MNFYSRKIDKLNIFIIFYTSLWSERKKERKREISISIIKTKRENEKDKLYIKQTLIKQNFDKIFYGFTRKIHLAE